MEEFKSKLTKKVVRWRGYVVARNEKLESKSRFAGKDRTPFWFEDISATHRDKFRFFSKSIVWIRRYIRFLGDGKCVKKTFGNLERHIGSCIP